MKTSSTASSVTASSAPAPTAGGTRCSSTVARGRPARPARCPGRGSPRADRARIRPGRAQHTAPSNVPTATTSRSDEPCKPAEPSPPPATAASPAVPTRTSRSKSAAELPTRPRAVSSDRVTHRNHRANNRVLSGKITTPPGRLSIAPPRDKTVRSHCADHFCRTTASSTSPIALLRKDRPAAGPSGPGRRRVCRSSGHRGR